MITLYAENSEVLKFYPDVVDKWKKMLINNGYEYDENKLEFFYSYGFFVKSKKNRKKFYEEEFNNSIKMSFDERLKYELSKIRINLSMKVGNFLVSDRMEKEIVPDSVEKITREITKVKMILESDYHDNYDVKNSIPELDESVASIEIIKEIDEFDEEENYVEEFDVDDILDKISKKGIKSLSRKEREFLNNKSKNI